MFNLKKEKKRFSFSFYFFGYHKNCKISTSSFIACLSLLQHFQTNFYKFIKLRTAYKIMINRPTDNSNHSSRFT